MVQVEIARPTPVGRAITTSGRAIAIPCAYGSGVSLAETIVSPTTTIRS
jgi:hypothetical protein